MECSSREVTLGTGWWGILSALELLERTGRNSKKRGPWVSRTPAFSALPCKVPRAASIPHLVMARVTEDMYSRNGSRSTKSALSCH